MILATIVAFTPVAAASAAEPYVWLACPSGTATTGIIDSITVDERLKVTVAGRVWACKTPQPNNAFGIASYGDADAEGTAVPFGDDKYLRVRRSGPVSHQVNAICLLSDSKTRLDCFALTFVAEPNSPPQVKFDRIATNDTRVQISARIDIGGVASVNPSCPGCWGAA